jgi:hypothetical protein
MSEKVVVDQNVRNFYNHLKTDLEKLNKGEPIDKTDFINRFDTLDPTKEELQAKLAGIKTTLDSISSVKVSGLSKGRSRKSRQNRKKTMKRRK